MKKGPLKKYQKRCGKDSFEPRKITISGKLYWQVHLPGTWDAERKVWVRKRRTVRDHEEAKTLAEQARFQEKYYGRKSLDISDDLRRDAQEAARLLKPLGASILESARFYAKHLEQERASVPVSFAVAEFMAARAQDNLRDRYLSDLRVRLNRFSQAFGDRPIAGIQAGELTAWLRGLPVKPATRNSIRLRLGVLFSYATERGWCQNNPVTHVKKVKAVTPVPGILTPEQFAKVLEAAGEETLPYWLIGGFAGLRRAEVERLEWKDIHFDSSLIEVPALKAKTASRRFVKIQPNLAAWLGPYEDRTGPVCPPNLRNLLEIDRVNAGVWTATERALKATGRREDGAKPKLKPWPSNGLRHSFASYHLAHFSDAARLALELGHTDQELLFRHYRELVTPDQAAKYWDIRPAAQTNLVAISA